MMRFGVASGDKAFTYANRKRQIGESTAVQVPKLAAPDPELDSAKSVGCD